MYSSSADASLAGIYEIIAAVHTEICKKPGPSPAETRISQLILLPQDGFKLPSENHSPGACTGV